MTAREYVPFDPLGDPHSFLDRNVSGFMLVPRSDARTTPIPVNEVAPRYCGWIQVTPGRMRERDGTQVLELTTIVAEDHKNLPFRPASWVSNLKKRLVRENLLKFGVTLAKFTGESSGHVLSDIGYSKTALELNRAGIIWMQNWSFTGYFIPVEGDW